MRAVMNASLLRWKLVGSMNAWRWCYQAGPASSADNAIVVEILEANQAWGRKRPCVVASTPRSPPILFPKPTCLSLRRAFHAGSVDDVYGSDSPDGKWSSPSFGCSVAEALPAGRQPSRRLWQRYRTSTQSSHQTACARAHRGRVPQCTRGRMEGRQRQGRLATIQVGENIKRVSCSTIRLSAVLWINGLVVLQNPLHPLEHISISQIKPILQICLSNSSK